VIKKFGESVPGSIGTKHPLLRLCRGGHLADCVSTPKSADTRKDQPDSFCIDKFSQSPEAGIVNRESALRPEADDSQGEKSSVRNYVVEDRIRIALARYPRKCSKAPNKCW